MTMLALMSFLFVCVAVLDNGLRRGRESCVDEQEANVEEQDAVLPHSKSDPSKVVLQSRSDNSKVVLQGGSDTSRIMDHTYVQNSFLSGDRLLGQIMC